MSEKRIVHTTSLFAIDNTFEDERFMRVRVAALHSNLNLNQSFIKTKAIKAAKNSFANIPILASTIVYTDKDGNQHLDYGSHDMHIEDDLFNDGEQRIIYDEKVVGVVPEKNNFEIIHDDETGNDYAYVDALIYRDYGNYCADILEQRGGTTSVSSELACNELVYNNEEKALEIKDFTMTGITLLGEDVNPAMKKANATVFSINEDNRQEQLMTIIKELTTALNNYTETINNTIKEGGKDVDKELLNEENTSEEVTEDVIETPSNEDDAEEVTEDEKVEVAETEEEFSEENDSEEDVSEDSEEDEVDDDTVESEASGDIDAAEEEIETETEIVTNSIQCSMSYNDKKIEFSTSLSEQLYALTELVNSQYEVDGTWYSVDAYTEPKKYVIMQDIFTGRAYKQDFKIKKEEYQLVGDRTEVYARFLTKDEIAQLDDMRKNYSEIESKLANYEAEPEKIELLNSKVYAKIVETDEYKEIAKRDAYFELSKEELEKKLDDIILKYAKEDKLNFSAVDNNESKKSNFASKPFPAFNKQGGSGRYGNLFSKEK